MAVTQSRATDDINAAFAIHFTADAVGGTMYLSSVALAKFGRVLSRTFFQVKGTVSVAFTLSPSKDAVSPDAQAEVLWDGPTTLTPLTITTFDKPFTAIKLVFAAGSEAHIAAN